MTRVLLVPEMLRRDWMVDRKAVGVIGISELWPGGKLDEVAWRRSGASRMRSVFRGLGVLSDFKAVVKVSTRFLKEGSVRKMDGLAGDCGTEVSEGLGGALRTAPGAAEPGPLSCPVEPPER